MRYELPFNEDLFKRQYKLNFDSVWKKNIKKNNSRLFFGSGFLIIGLLMLYAKKDVGVFFLAIALFYFLNFYNYYYHFLKQQRSYNDAVNKLIKRQSASYNLSVWEFKEEYFRYKDFRIDFKIIWSEFKDFKIIEDNIFISLDTKNYNSYIIAKGEVGSEDFDKLINFLNEKVKGQIPIQNRAKD